VIAISKPGKSTRKIIGLENRMLSMDPYYMIKY